MARHMFNFNINHEEILSDTLNSFAKYLADNILEIAREIAEEKEATEFLTVNEMQEFLDIKRAKAYELTNIKGFPAYKIGGIIRINKNELVRWIRENPKEVS